MKSDRCGPCSEGRSFFEVNNVGSETDDEGEQ